MTVRGDAVFPSNHAIRSIDFLGRSALFAPWTAAFVAWLRELDSCRTIAIKYRWLEGRTERHAIDGLHALNFVAHGGGVSRSLCLDNYGEALSAALLGFELDIPDNLGGHLRGLA